MPGGRKNETYNRIYRSREYGRRNYQRDCVRQIAQTDDIAVYDIKSEQRERYAAQGVRCVRHDWRACGGTAVMWFCL